MMDAAPHPIRALLLDLDGVVRLWRPEHTAEAEQLAGLPLGAIHRTAFAPDLLVPAITGRLRDDDWRRQVVERLSTAFPAADAEGAVAAWSAPAGEIDQAVLAVVRACRRRMPVVLVTNATSRLDHDLERLGLTGEFDHVVNSSSVGWGKPHPEIFTAALSVAGVAAPHACFVDDTAANVDAAIAMGMRGHVYQGVVRLREVLSSRALFD
jgi:putative hydrolase of the HAD superfamily